MTWDSASGRGRWVKKKHGKTHRIGVKRLVKLYPELASSPTRSGTVHAANEWWSEQEKQLFTAEHSSELRTIEILKQVYLTNRQYAEQLSDPTLLYIIDASLATLKRLESDPSVLKGVQLVEPNGYETRPSELLQARPLSPVSRAQQHLRRMILEDIGTFADVIPVALPKLQTVPHEDRSLVTITKTYLNARRLETRKRSNGTAQLSPGRYKELELLLRQFREFVPADSTIDSVNNADTLRQYHTFLMDQIQQGIANETARKRLAALRQFLRWCYENEFLEQLPKNISSRGLSIPIEHREPKLFPLNEFRNIFNAANERTKLFLALIANTGFRQRDIAVLKVRDLNGDHIVHARVKTAKHNPPVVRYLLWERTRKLLQNYLQSEKCTRKLDPESLIFLSPNGNPIASQELNEQDGKQQRKDLIDKAYRRLLDKLNVSKVDRCPLGSLRTTSADMIRKQFGLELQQLFLGHKPRDVASLHYTATHNDTRLDEPLQYLEKKYAL